MSSIFKGLTILACLSALPSSCGILSGRKSPADICDRFFSRQGTHPLPGELFADESAKKRAEQLIARRESMMGAYISRKRVGSNRRMVLESGVRKDTAVFIFEVISEGGRTLETITVSRSRPSKSYRITSYEIENIPEPGDQDPMDTRSV